jgi:hypothetical protein
MARVTYNLEQIKSTVVSTDENVDDISHRLENSPPKSLRRLARKNGVSLGSAWTATKCLHIFGIKLFLCLNYTCGF